ncbi:uncharacterized protein A4U43_UnF6400 [Asparagus officinalis]|uniref:FAD-binding PCMH-type domain-containing protein n=1 Tax=Asparagus officinalis TaxID=4686 RepID=A0A1R3L6G9_ASPOF|nr:berberine bridge enzyme-like 22 [Asparagus officinalis]ONK55207.1 uncharacterized protein A4U43_UnF6400 [Asparagus officinalis]
MALTPKPPLSITTLANLTILSLLFFSGPSHSTQPLDKTQEQRFVDCFGDLIHDPLLNFTILHALGTPSYEEYFKAPIKNLRFINSTSNKPSFIMTPTSLQQISNAFVCARNASFHIRARSGGHDYEGLSYISQSSNPYILIDLNSSSIVIDIEKGNAMVQSGATIGELYYEIAQKSNTTAFPAGICPTIGVGGHFIGGGIGALMRKYGVSADNIEDVRVVRPDGALVGRINMGEDHFWAIRGGGSNFGIITAFQIRLVSVPPIVTTFAITKTLEQGAARLVERWQHVAPKLDDDAFIRIIALAADDKESNEKRTINATFQCLFLGGASKLVAIMDEKFPELGVKPEDCEEMSWIQSVLDFAGYGKNASLEILKSRKPQFEGSYKGKSDFVKEPISEKGWNEIWRFMMEGKDEPVVMIMDPWGGKLDEIDEGDIAFPHRKGNLYNIQYFMRWPEKDEQVAKRHLDWMRKFYELMTPYVSKSPRAAYLNYKDLDLGWNKETSTNYSDASVWGEKYFLNNYKKLAYVKGKVDPYSIMWDEQSIHPLL